VSAYFAQGGSHELKVQNWFGNRSRLTEAYAYASPRIVLPGESPSQNAFSYTSSNREFKSFAGALKVGDDLRLEGKLIRSRGNRPVLRLYNPSSFDFQTAKFQKISLPPRFAGPNTPGAPGAPGGPTGSPGRPQTETLLEIGPIPAHSTSEFTVYDKRILELLNAKLSDGSIPELWFRATMDIPKSWDVWGKPGGGQATFSQQVVIREGNGGRD
jgi:hypothetical protein